MSNKKEKTSNIILKTQRGLITATDVVKSDAFTDNQKMNALYYLATTEIIDEDNDTIRVESPSDDMISGANLYVLLNVMKNIDHYHEFSMNKVFSIMKGLYDGKEETRSRGYWMITRAEMVAKIVWFIYDFCMRNKVILPIATSDTTIADYYMAKQSALDTPQGHKLASKLMGAHFMLETDRPTIGVDDDVRVAMIAALAGVTEKTSNVEMNEDDIMSVTVSSYPINKQDLRILIVYLKEKMAWFNKTITNISMQIAASEGPNTGNGGKFIENCNDNFVLYTKLLKLVTCYKYRLDQTPEVPCYPAVTELKLVVNPTENTPGMYWVDAKLGLEITRRI